MTDFALDTWLNASGLVEMSKQGLKEKVIWHFEVHHDIFMGFVQLAGCETLGPWLISILKVSLILLV